MKDQTVIIYCERLTVEEELDFLTLINNAVEDGELTAQEASDMIDREYELQAAIGR